MNLRILVTGIFTILLFNIAFPQFPGKKSRKDFIAVDNYVYKIGSEIEVTNPMKGEEYASILIYREKSFAEKTDEVVNGANTEEERFKPALKKIRGFKGVIKYFKIFELQDGKKVHFAIIPYENEMNLAISLNSAIAIGEVKSKNIDYKNEIELTKSDTENKETYIKSFSPNFDVKLVSVKGHKETQTIEIIVIVKHKSVHQEICIDFNKNYAKIYDFEGNEYLAKSAFIGAINNDFMSYVCNKIPTNVPVKCGITFRQILPNVENISFFTVRIRYKATDGGKYENGTLEINNLKVDWE